MPCFVVIHITLCFNPLFPSEPLLILFFLFFFTPSNSNPSDYNMKKKIIPSPLVTTSSALFFRKKWALMGTSSIHDEMVKGLSLRR